MSLTSGHKWKKVKTAVFLNNRKWWVESRTSYIHPCLFFTDNVLKNCHFSKWKKSICWGARNYEHSGYLRSACLSRRDKDNKRVRKSSLPHRNAGETQTRGKWQNNYNGRTDSFFLLNNIRLLFKYVFYLSIYYTSVFVCFCDTSSLPNVLFLN